jgi:uncharacterized membrane protein YbaN (DUF454 family)
MLTTTDFSIRHSIPGRLRITFPALVSNKNQIRKLNALLSDSPGINRVRSNHLCGSFIIHYNPEISDRQHLLEMIKDVRWHDLVPPDVRISRVNTQKPIPHDLPRNHEKRKGVRRLWNLAGGISVGVGIVGVFLPLLPTVPLFLLAGFCYWRGSPRFYNRLISFGPVGRLVDNFQKGKGLPAKMKSRAIVFMWLSMGTSMIFFLTSTTLRLILLLVGIVVTLYILGIKTADPLITTPERRRIPAKIN